MQIQQRPVHVREALERGPAEQPDLVIVDASDPESTEGDLLERLARQFAGACLMLLVGEQQHELLIRAMRAGVREVLPLPLVHRAFHEAVDRASDAAA